MKAIRPSPKPPASFPPLEKLATSVWVSGLAFTPGTTPELPAGVRPLLLDRLQLGWLAVAGAERGSGRLLHHILPRFGGLKNPRKINPAKNKFPRKINSREKILDKNSLSGFSCLRSKRTCWHKTC